jgi:ferritin
MVSLSGSITEALQAHAKLELEANLLYLQAYHWLEVRHFDGLAEKVKSFGEKRRDYQKKLLEYVTLRGGEVEVRTAPLPAVEWADEIKVFEYFFDLEQAYYEKIKAVFALARTENEFDVETLVSELLEQQVVRVDEWEGEVLKVRGYNRTPGLIWLYNDRKA